jgi:hypothetical protein
MAGWQEEINGRSVLGIPRLPDQRLARVPKVDPFNVRNLRVALGLCEKSKPEVREVAET